MKFLEKIPAEVKITLIYLVFGLAWIFLTDRALLFFSNNDELFLTRAQSYKGFFFVFLTAILILVLMRVFLAQSRREKNHFLSLTKAAGKFVVFRLKVWKDHNRTHFVPVFASDNIETILGATSGQDFENWFQKIHPDDAALFSQKVMEPLGSMQSAEAEFRIWHQPTKEWRWIQLSSYPVKNKTTDHYFVNGVILDLQEQKNLLKQMIESERRFQQLTTSIDQAFYLTDWETKKTLYVSPLFQEIFERPPDFLFNDAQAWMEIIHPNDKESVKNEYDRSKPGEFNMSYRIITPSGKLKWIKNSEFRVAAGEPSSGIRIAGIIKDITAEVETNERLLYAEQKQRSILNAVPSAIFYVGPDGKFEFANRAFQEFSGKTEAQILCEEPETIFNHPENKAIFEGFQKVKKGSYFSLSCLLKINNGPSIQAKIDLIPNFGREGLVTGFFGSITDLSKERETLQQLQRSKEFLSLSSKMAKMGGWTYLPERKELFWSEEAIDLIYPCHKKAEGIEGLLQLFSEEDRQNLIEAIKNLEENDLAFQLTLRCFQEEGNRRWFSLMARKGERKNGNTLIVGSLQDITEQKKNEQEVILAKLNLEAVLNNTPDLIWSFDKAIKLTSCNRQFLIFANRYSGTNLSIGASLIKESDADPVSNFWKEIYLHCLSGKPVIRELDTELNGEKRFFEISISPIIEKENHVLGGVCIAREVTHRKKMELQLRESEELFRQLSASAPVGIILLDKMGKISYTNDRFLSILSVDFWTQHQPMFIAQLIEDNRKGQFERLWSKLSKEGKNLNIRTNLFLNEERRVVSLSISKIALENVTDYAFIGVIEDITDRVYNEEKIVATILETEDRERTRIANELHDSLTQNLTVSCLNFDAIKEEVQSLRPEAKARFQVGMEFLNQSIDESRNIAHALMPKSISDFGYSLSLEELIDHLNQAQKIHFSYYTNLNGRRLPGKTELHLYRITQEAINNCLKHSGATKVFIQLMDYEDQTILTIEDDGAGFNLDEIREKTTGIGLSGIEHRVRSMGGEVVFESQKGKGAHITVTLPK